MLNVFSAIETPIYESTIHVAQCYTMSFLLTTYHCVYQISLHAYLDGGWCDPQTQRTETQAQCVAFGFYIVCYLVPSVRSLAAQVHCNDKFIQAL